MGWDVENGVERPTVALYDLEGHGRGQYESPNGLRLSALWLPDSSGFFIWNVVLDQASKPGPVVVMERNGKVHSTGLEGIDPAISPNRAWVAATHLGQASSRNAVQVVSYSGGAARTVVEGENVLFLGWEGDQIVYFAKGGIYAIPVVGGSATRFVSLRPEDDVTQPPVGPISSPDSQVLIVFLNQTPFVLARGKLRSLMEAEAGAFPLPAVASQLGLWTGPHEALGLLPPQSELVILDLLTGAVERHTGLYGIDMADAVSWPWLTWRAGTLIHITSLETKIDLNLGEEPVAGGIFPLGEGRFLLHGNGETYLMNPSLAGR
ncbi:MAG: hypothetical protein KGJ80_05335 [Chloroflexota bacterium]|nr:hypothetical protein [Chloroflexota bacterium]